MPWRLKQPITTIEIEKYENEFIIFTAFFLIQDLREITLCLFFQSFHLIKMLVQKKLLGLVSELQHYFDPDSLSANPFGNLKFAVY